MKVKIAWVVGNLLLTGCMIPRAEQTETERFRFETSHRPSLEVRLDDGSIDVLGTSSNQVNVVVHKRARAHREEVAAALLDELLVDVLQEGDRVLVEVRRATSPGSSDRHFSVHSASIRSDIEIRVPRETDLTLITEDGRIDVERIDGDIEAESGDGRLRFREVRGTVRSSTSDGSIVGVDLIGDVDVSTEDGRIELAGSFGSLTAATSDGSIKVEALENSPPSTEDWVIRTSDGSIDLTLPSDFSADLEATTADGRIVNDLPLDVTHESKTRLKGRLGQGGKLVLIRTSDGRIVLKSP
jgi:hypothetical protein